MSLPPNDDDFSELPEMDGEGVAGLRPPDAAALARAQPLFEQALAGLRAARPAAAGPKPGMGPQPRLEALLGSRLEQPARERQEPRQEMGLGPTAEPAPETGQSWHDATGVDLEVTQASGAPSLPEAGESCGDPPLAGVDSPPAAGREPAARSDVSATYPRGRRYDLALRALGAQPEPPVTQPPPAPATQPTRPPAHAPQIRPSARRAAPAANRLPPEPWLADRTSSLLRSLPDGARAFDLAITDPALGPLTCTITVREGQATATFYAADGDTRRLLSAEAGRLRVMLESRGLRVAAVTVQAEADPG